MSGSPSYGIPSEELAGDIGAPDAADMQTVRDLFLREEPLVEDAVFDSTLAPRELHIQFADGIGEARWSRLDVTWYTTDAYRFHHVNEAGVNWQFDRHPNDHSSERHFHEPPAAVSKTARQSCITVEEPRLVARAVLNLWRRAYETDSMTKLNNARNPP
jgi:hypothetical protein